MYLPRSLVAWTCLALVWGCATPAAVETPQLTATPEDLVGLEPALRPGTVVVLGELHGTVEAPAFLSRVVGLALERGLGVTVGIEIPLAEAARVRTFLASAGGLADRDELLEGAFWRSSYQDGRPSEAMVGLLDDLRRHREAGSPVRVVCFDVPARAAVREEAMAEALADAIAGAPRDFTVVLTGNLHARLARGGQLGVSAPMALQLARQLPRTRLVTLKLAYSGGTAWICGSAGGCGSTRLAGRDRASLQVFPRGDHGVTAPGFGAGRIFVRGNAAVRLLL